jgi:hypothetical protein
VITVAPVVVRPDTDSNTASVIDKCGSSARMNGKAPIPDSTVQNITTTTKPSRRRSSRWTRRTGSQLSTPTPKVRPNALAKAGAAPSLTASDNTKGGTSVKLKTVSNRPRMR